MYSSYKGKLANYNVCLYTYRRLRAVFGPGVCMLIANCLFSGRPYVTTQVTIATANINLYSWRYYTVATRVSFYY